MRRIVLTLSFLLAYTAAALAQSGCPQIVTGAVLTAAQWNNCFMRKTDNLGYTPLSINGGAMAGRLVTAASTTTAAGFNIPAGAAPTSPVDGDIWTTTAGVFARINGSTIGLGGGTVLLANGSVGAPSLAFSSDTTTGLYRIGSGNIGVAASGVNVLGISVNGISIQNGTSAAGFSLEARPSVTTFPVPALRPTTTNSVIAVDILPNGTPTESATNGYAWFDVCDTDLVSTPAAATVCTRQGIKSDRAEFGSRSFNGAVAKPVSFMVSNVEYMRIGITGLVSVTNNTSALPAPRTNTAFQIGGANSSALFLGLDSFGNANQIYGRRSNGTATSPSGLISGDQITSFAALGYGTTAYSAASRASFQFLAAESWTDTAQGTGIRILVTPNGTIVPAEVLAISNAGIVSVDATTVSTSTTTGALTVAGGLGVAGAINAASGTFASLGLTGPVTVTSNSANCLAAGPNGTTNPSFQVDCSTGSAVTGVKVTSNIAGSGAQIAAMSSNTNDSLSVLAKGTGTVQIGTGSQQVTIGGTAGTIALRFINDNLTGFGSRAPLETNNYANSQETMRWAQSVITSFATFRANSNLVANATQTIASGASVAWNDFEVASHTTTLTGTTTITSPFAKSVFFGGTLTNASAVTVNNAAAVFIDAAPVAAGSVTIGAGWSLFINSGRALFGGGLTTNIGSTIMVPTQTIVSAGAAVWSDLELSDSTMTLTGTTTVNALARAYIGGGTITDSSSVTVTSATTMFVAAPPAAAGSVTITNPWAFRVGSGNAGLPAGGYLNFGATGSSSSGTNGYGIRDNGGVMEKKNSGGAWSAL